MMTKKKFEILFLVRNKVNFMMRDKKNGSPFFLNNPLEDTLRLQAFRQMEDEE